MAVQSRSPTPRRCNNLVAGVSYDGGFTNYDADGYVGGITQDLRVYYTPAGIPNPGYLLDEQGTVPVGVVIRNAYEGLYLSDSFNVTDKFTITAGWALEHRQYRAARPGPARPQRAWRRPERQALL